MVSFSKTNDANWQVPWHQDRVILVRDRMNVSGFTNWSNKVGQWHCQPPSDVLEDMLFVRVFLDSCDAQSGGMEFAVGSHANGIVPASEAATNADRFPTSIETAEAGDILVLPMLTLHRSVPAKAPNGRHVLRLDFARSALPEPMLWSDFK
ncbi:phytanoyl-CoA dioxygenase family protein [Octadecabacter temperatus]|nr:phytanoyl-CoA dioxygenase family protein [Octadecabacter temperatus]